MTFDASNLVPCTNMSGRSLQLVYLFQELLGGLGSTVSDFERSYYTALEAFPSKKS